MTRTRGRPSQGWGAPAGTSMRSERRGADGGVLEGGGGVELLKADRQASVAVGRRHRSAEGRKQAGVAVGRHAATRLHTRWRGEATYYMGTVALATAASGRCKRRQGTGVSSERNEEWRSLARSAEKERAREEGNHVQAVVRIWPWKLASGRR
jgi:hypothetical protein